MLMKLTLLLNRMQLFSKPLRELIGFNDLPLRLIGLPVIAVLMPMTFFQVMPWEQFDEYIQHFLGAIIFAAIYWQVDRLIIAYHRDRFSGLGNYRKRLLLQSFWILVFTLSFCNFADAFEAVTGLSIGHPSKPSTLKLNLASVTITIAITAIYEAAYGVYMWKKSFIESERLKKENMQAQLETLKNQVNPHFLFNSLNALTSMVHDEPDMAVEFVQKLSKVYRYILEIKNKEMITLSEEMECIDAYRFLIQMRFGDNVRFKIDIPKEHLQCHIVPLSIQILLENAIKHNIISTAKPLEVSILVAKNGNLVVANNLQKKNQVSDSTKTGIANIKSRYQLLTGKEVHVIVTQSQFSVSVPLIHVEEYETAHH